MKRKSLIGISLLFCIGFGLMWHFGSFADNPKVFDTTIVFGNNDSIRVFAESDPVTKNEYCSMVEHAGNSSCGTNTPSDHPLSEQWDPDRKVVLKLERNVVGYGQVKASFVSGSTVVGNQTVTLDEIGGDTYDVGIWRDRSTVDPTEFTSYTKAHFFCPEDAEPNTYTWNASGKVEIWGVDWEGTGTVTISQSVGVTLGLAPAGNYSVSVGQSESLTSDVSGNASDRAADRSGTWTLVHDNVCGHVQCWKSLIDPHAHHWWCPTDNGCGNHIVCKDYIPEKHMLHASCWNKKYGCPAEHVRVCAHNCDYDLVICRGCGDKIPKEKYRSDSDKAIHKQILCSGNSCNDTYYLCNSSDANEHRPRVCVRSDGYYHNGQYYHMIDGIMYEGMRYCYTIYRECSNSTCSIDGLLEHTDYGAADGECPVCSGISAISEYCVIHD